MVGINLLKDQQRAARRARRRARIELFAGAFVLVVVAAWWGWVVVDGSHALQRLERSIRDKQDHVALLTQRQNLALTLQEQRDAAVAKHTAFMALTRHRDRPIRVLSVISRVVDPSDVWLRRLQARDEKVTLSGVALSREGIVNFAKDLEHTDMFGPVNVFESRVHATQPALFQFSMNIVMDTVDHG